MNLILLEPGEVSPDGRARLADRRAAHIVTVLRGTAGREIRVGVVDGPMGTATVLETDASAPGVELQCVFDRVVPERPPVDVLLALPRPKVMRRLWTQLSAIGVGRIMISNAERVERNYFDTHVLAPQHVRPQLVDGLQQARDTRLPIVTIHRQFRVLIEDELDTLVGDAVRLVAHPTASPSMHASVRSALSGGSGAPALARDPPYISRHEVGRVSGQQRVPAPANHTDEQAPGRGDAPVPRTVQRRLLVAVGPEGGWNDFELRLPQAHRFQMLGMGTRTLRADTACVALLTLAHDAYRQARARLRP